MEDIQLSKTHKRILSTLLFVLEQKIESIEHMIMHPAENASYFISQDLSEKGKQELLATCKSLKEELFEMGHKLELKKRTISQAQYISTIQSQMWEHISDAYSDKLKGYGEKLKSDAKSVDPYIEKLSGMINSLRL